MPSDYTQNLLRSAHDRLMAYVDPAGKQLNQYLLNADASDRVYQSLAPDEVSYPYIVMRSTNATPDLDVGGLREFFDIEMRCVHKSRAVEPDCETIADLAELALLTWRESTAALGVTYGYELVRRDTVPPESDVANRELTEVFVVVRVCSWAKMLTSAL